MRQKTIKALPTITQTRASLLSCEAFRKKTAEVNTARLLQWWEKDPYIDVYDVYIKNKCIYSA